jgi:hypothetical protein
VNVDLRITVCLPVTLTLRVRVPNDEGGSPEPCGSEVVGVDTARARIHVSVREANEAVAECPEEFEAAIRRALEAARG